MASTKSKAETATATAEPDLTGFTDETSVEIDGWYKAEMGSNIFGKISGYTSFRDNEGNLREVVIVRLRQPATAYQKGSDTPGILEEGKYLGVSVSHDLKTMLDYVEHKGECFIRPVKKVALGGKKSMWKFEKKFKGEKSARPQPEDQRSQDIPDDDIPF